MSHTIANLEHHHFKYEMFRRPGDVHVHFFGTATLSFGDGVATAPGDVFEIEAAPFRLPVRNPVAVAEAVGVSVRVLWIGSGREVGFTRRREGAERREGAWSSRRLRASSVFMGPA